MSVNDEKCDEKSKNKKLIKNSNLNLIYCCSANYLKLSEFNKNNRVF